MRAKRVSMHHGLNAIQVAREGPHGGQSLDSPMALRAMRCPFSSSVACAHEEDLVELR